MAFDPISAAVSAGFKLFDYQQQESAREDAQHRAEIAEQTRKFERDQDYQRQLAFSETAYNRQKEFAQMGTRWKVQDAIAAGLHPLYALGGSGASYSPGSITIGGSAPVSPSIPGHGELSGMGQDISRAINQTRTPEERQIATLNLERAGLENDLLRAQIAKIGQGQSGPGMPSSDANSPLNIPGQQPGDVKGSQRSVGSAVVPPGSEHQESGASPDIGYGYSVNGRYPIVPSDRMKQRIEDSPYEWTHFWRQLKNHMMAGQIQGPYPAPAGQQWRFYPDEMSVGLVPKGKKLFPSNPFFNIEVPHSFEFEWPKFVH